MKAKVLGQIADPPPRIRIAGWLAEDARRAAAWLDQAKQDFDGRGLARAVGSQKAEDLA
jgi:hypothetical protein